MILRFDAQIVNQDGDLPSVRVVYTMRKFDKANAAKEEKLFVDMSPEMALRFADWVNENRVQIVGKMRYARETTAQWAREHRDAMGKLATELAGPEAIERHRKAEPTREMLEDVGPGNHAKDTVAKELSLETL